MKRRAFDQNFKKMAVELSFLKGSLKATAEELGLDAGRISKWRQQAATIDRGIPPTNTLTEEQKQIKRLQKELREAQLDRIAELDRGAGATPFSGAIFLVALGPTGSGYRLWGLEKAIVPGAIWLESVK